MALWRNTVEHCISGSHRIAAAVVTTGPFPTKPLHPVNHCTSQTRCHNLTFSSPEPPHFPPQLSISSLSTHPRRARCLSFSCPLCQSRSLHRTNKAVQHRMATKSPSGTPSVNDPTSPVVDMPNSASSTSSSSSVHEDEDRRPRTPQGLKRPKMTSRKSSGTIIVPREHPRVELKEGDEVFDEDDARAMSPRRSSQDLEKMSQEARAQLNEHVSSSLSRSS